MCGFWACFIDNLVFLTGGLGFINVYKFSSLFTTTILYIRVFGMRGLIRIV